MFFSLHQKLDLKISLRLLLWCIFTNNFNINNLNQTKNMIFELNIHIK